MLRNFAGVFLGLIVAMCVVALVEIIGMVIYPPHPDLMSADVEKRAAAMAALPAGSFGFVLAAWTIGSFVGSFLAAYICNGRRQMMAGVIASFLWVAALVNLITIPGPLWFGINGLVLIPLAFWLGCVLAILLRPSPRPGPQPYDMREKGMACK
ncbi:hypothetical protein NA78x_005969 [Anatilimnocola sp. NA78]|uniref:hypothetical protein n=1 Tax=Anatilimnocola sp. NA78 TaxID=3415683 RepID=UPI003CE4CB95